MCWLSKWTKLRKILTAFGAVLAVSLAEESDLQISVLFYLRKRRVDISPPFLAALKAMDTNFVARVTKCITRFKLSYLYVISIRTTIES